MEKISEEKFIEIGKLANQGKIKEASELFKKLVEENPEHLRLKVAFADFLISFDDITSALNVLRQAIKIDSENLDARYLFAIAQIKACRFYLAQKELEFLLAKDPLALRLKKELGWVKMMQGDPEQGRNILREVISADLTNADVYMDLGVSFINTLDFDQAIHWLGIAKNLKPNDPLILDGIEHAKKMQKEFEKLSEKDQQKARQVKNNPQQLKEESIQNTLKFATEQANLSQEDMEDMRKELELAGFNPDFGMFSQPTTKAEKESVEYLEYHQKVPNVERRITRQEFEILKENLLNPKLPEEESKIILIALGHQGTKEAISLLKEYQAKASKPLKRFAQMALEECEIFSQDNPSKFIPFNISKRI